MPRPSDSTPLDTDPLWYKDAIIYQVGINADFSHRPIKIGETWHNHFGVGYGKSGLRGRSEEVEV